MKRFLLLLVALSILNQSVDIDYCTIYASAGGSGDDIDSVLEMFVENVADDHNYTDESDDDTGFPKNLPFQKDAHDVLYFQELKPGAGNPAPNTADINSTYIASITCKGHRFLVSPPPDVIFTA